MTRSTIFFALMASWAAAVGTSVAAAELPVPTALSTLLPGQWVLRSRDGSAPPISLCLGDPRILLQIKHGTMPCGKYMIANDPVETVVSYSCAGGANGRTMIRVETSRVIQIESQGIEGKLPFDLAYEGRRIGVCPISRSTARQ